MTSSAILQTEEDPSYGVIVRCADEEVADEFDDFLNEQKYVLFNRKFEERSFVFFFGQASSKISVEALIREFEGRPRT